MTTPIPFSQEAEDAVIGALLIDSTTVYKVSDLVGIGDFYVAKNGFVYEAISRLVDRRIDADYVTICDELERMGRLEEIGGAAYLTGLLSVTPTALGIEHYAQIVRRKAYQRRAIATAGEIAIIAHADNESTIQERQERIEGLVFALAVQDKGQGLIHISEQISVTYDEMDLRQTEGVLPGVQCGFKNIDNLIGGFHGGDMVVVAARPSMGKTALMLGMGHNVAKAGGNVAMFSLEMSTEQLVKRLISAEMEIDSQRLRIGKLRDDEWGNFVQVTAGLSQSGIYIDDTPGVAASQIRASLRRLVARIDVDVAIIDYLQLMQSHRRWNNPVAEYTEISKAVKGLAKEFDIPIVIGSQLSRACEQRKDKRPILSDLRETGAIEQDSDIVMFIYRDEYYNENTEQPNIAEIATKKHRNGPTGMVPLFFKKEQAMFVDVDLFRQDLEPPPGF